MCTHPELDAVGLEDPSSSECGQSIESVLKFA